MLRPSSESSLQPNNNKNNIFIPTPPSPWQRFSQHPTLFLTTWLYTHRPPTLAPLPLAHPSRPIKVLCISDTHNEQPMLPNADILIHAGDLTINGTHAQLQAQLTWLNSLPHGHKVVIGGNHDLLLDPAFYTRYPNQRLAGPANDEKMLKKLDWGSVTYLDGSSATLHVRDQTIRVYGSPMTPEYGNWAFQYPRGKDMWSGVIPSGMDIVVTHGPAKGHVDMDGKKGCAWLNRELWRVKPRLHVCGHIHVGRGVEYVDWGLLQWGYDTVCRGEGRLVMEMGMLLAWVWMWMCYGVLGPRRSRAAMVNAAVVGPRGLFEGEESIVVEL